MKDGNLSKKVIVTGASGFVGANLTRRLIAEGHEVYLLLRPNCRTWRLNDILGHVGTRFVQFQEIDSLYITVNEIRPNWIFHLAGHGANSWEKDWREMVETNMLGTINLLECASQIGVEAFVNTGCFSEYGFSTSPACETQTLEPNSYFSITKIAQSMTSRCFAGNHNLYVPTLRLFSVYGPWQDPRQFLPSLILEGLQGKLPPPAELKSRNDYVYVDDVVDAFLKVVQKSVHEKGPVFNIGTGCLTSDQELIEIASKEFELKKKAKLPILGAKESESKESCADITKARKNLDWFPSIDLEVGFKKFATWFKENPDFIELYKNQREQISAKK